MSEKGFFWLGLEVFTALRDVPRFPFVPDLEAIRGNLKLSSFQFSSGGPEHIR